MSVRLLNAVILAGVINHDVVADTYGSRIDEDVQQGQIYDVAEAAKEKTISGVVTDDLGGGLPGVSIVIAGTTVGTTSDLDGRYTLDVPNSEAVLTFFFIGMKREDIVVGDKEVIDVMLMSESIGLNEVVSIGYAKQKKSDVTGAVVSVGSDDFNKGAASSPGQLLKGKVSGVNVTSSSGAPGSGQSIVIRGQGTVRQGAGPLFVIDGFPFGLAGTGSGSSPLNFINPEDIETMTVLKDASATAIYGSRGANGVILITTKKGSAGNFKLSVNSQVSVSKMANKISVFDADEFRENVVAIGGILEDRGGNTDWQDELSQTGVTQDYNLTMSGGVKDMVYRASLGYLDQEGILINTGIQRYSGRVNATQKLINDRLVVDFNLNSTVEKGENANSSSIVSNMLTFNPTYEAYNNITGEPTKFPDLINPLSDAELKKTFSESRTTIVGIAPSFEIVDGLVYKLNLGYRNQSSNSDYQEMPSVNPAIEGYLSQSTSLFTSTLLENYLTYSLSKSAHDLSVMAGYSYQRDYSLSNSWSISGFEANGIEPRYNPGLGQIMDLASNRPSGSATINELQSYFSRAAYNYNGKYMLTGTLRVDGSSKFGENNKYGYFPSFATGWRISEEDFMANSFLSNLKIRAGWGQTGNQEIPSKITQASYQSSNDGEYTYPLDESGSYPVGTAYTRLANPDIQWEVSTQSNVGLDFGLFNGALSGTVDYFYKVSTNILMEVTSFDPISPASTFWTNVDDMKIINQGVEMALDYQYRNDNGFSYSVGANTTISNNVVQDSPFTILTTGTASGSGLTGATINGMVNGYSVGSFYMKKFTGIGEDGLSTYEPAPSEGGDDRFVVGSALPKLLYNFYMNFEYKGFDLGINFNGVQGNKIYNNTALSQFYKAQLATSNNTTSKALEFDNEALTNPSAVSTRYLENGSFLRLDNVSLGYNLDTKRLGINDWAKDVRLSATGQNLFVITDYSGYDPEVNQDKSTGGVQSFGIDDNAYPKARTFMFGVNVTF